MSVPSSKTTVTADRPNLETERTSSRAGRPDMAELDGEGDEPLDLLGRQARAVREHLDLDVGDVGHGVDRQLERPF
jgi:hypothetical protein